MNKNQKILLGVLITVIAVALFYFANLRYNFLAVTSTSKFIQLPLKGFYSCDEAVGQVITSQAQSLPASETLIKCPSNSRQCDLTFNMPSRSLLSLPAYLKVSRNGQITTTTPTTSQNSYKIQNVVSTDVIKVTYLSTLAGLYTSSPITGATYTATYVPFVLWKTSPTTGSYPITTQEQGCVVPVEGESNLIYSDTLGYGAGTATANRLLQYKETRNFIDIFIPVSVENQRIQGDKYCANYGSGSKLYQIDSVTLASGTYSIVNTGKIISSVECCNGDVIPAVKQCQNNKWVLFANPNEPSEIECDNAFKQCTGDTNVPYTKNQLVRSVCENNKCVQKLTAVQCTNNGACSGSTPVCDTSIWKCVAGQSPTGTPTDGNEGKNQSIICSSCEDFALSNLVGFAFPSKKCEAKSILKIPTQTPTICFLSFIKLLLIPIVLILGTLLGSDMLLNIKALGGSKIASLLIALIISGIIAYLIYVTFWVGVIIFGVYLIFRAFLVVTPVGRAISVLR